MYVFNHISRNFIAICKFSAVNIDLLAGVYSISMGNTTLICHVCHETGTGSETYNTGSSLQ